VSSAGATIGADAAAAAPIHAINSGPAMAPSAAARVVRDLVDDEVFDAVVFDSGGTTCDITLVRAGEIVTTRETWIGQIGAGHITGFPSVDIRSIAAGGGSIARVDAGGLLHVGPESAGAEPGPACYGNGGTQPTLTDAALIAGYLDGDTFLGGGSSLSRDAAKAAVGAVAERLEVDVETAAASIVDLATEQMVGAIEQIVLGRGVDPRSAILVGAGGAAGLNVVEIARRLGARRAVVPAFASVLSAAGALMSPLSHDYTVAAPVSSARFDRDVVDRALALLRRHEAGFARLYGLDVATIDRAYSVEARYEHQVWDLVVPIPALERVDVGSLSEITEAFHRAHESSFGMRSTDVPVEFLSWNVKVSAPETAAPSTFIASAPRAPRSRALLFGGVAHHAGVVSVADLAGGARVEGPAVVEATSTSVVLPPGSAATLTAAGHLLLEPFVERAESAPSASASITAPA
jgi:N-methylhydantoinase A